MSKAVERKLMAVQIKAFNAIMLTVGSRACKGEMLAHSWDIAGSKHYKYCKHRITNCFLQERESRHIPILYYYPLHVCTHNKF